VNLGWCRRTAHLGCNKTTENLTLLAEFSDIPRGANGVENDAR
jgi:hypothetical protein